MKNVFCLFLFLFTVGCTKKAEVVAEAPVSATEATAPAATTADPVPAQTELGAGDIAKDAEKKVASATNYQDCVTMAASNADIDLEKAKADCKIKSETK